MLQCVFILIHAKLPTRGVGMLGWIFTSRNLMNNWMHIVFFLKARPIPTLNQMISNQHGQKRINNLNSSISWTDGLSNRPRHISSCCPWQHRGRGLLQWEQKIEQVGRATYFIFMFHVGCNPENHCQTEKQLFLNKIPLIEKAASQICPSWGLTHFWSVGTSSLENCS